MRLKSKGNRLRNACIAGGVIIGIAGSILAVVMVNAFMTGSFGWLFWLYSGLAAVIITGVSISLKNRIKEIKGGEEDEASYY